MRRTILLMLVMSLVAGAADNQLTPEERRGGWKLLFDGKSFANWQDPAKKKQPGNAWAVENGTLRTVQKPRIEEDLLSAREYGDFELLFDWRVTEKGNTGLKYRLQSAVFVDNSRKQEGPGGFEAMLGREIESRRSDRTKLESGATGFVYTIGFEYQLIDDERNADALRGADRQTGALYSMIPATTKAAKPAGQWNTSRLVVKGTHFEHWLNGTKVNEGSLDDPRVVAGVQKRWKDVPAVREALLKPKPRGYFALQHHGDEAWFRNIKVKELR